MAVAKNRKSRIVIDEEIYFWGVSPHIPGDDYPTLVVVSSDKKLCFHYPLDHASHARFLASLAEMELRPPVPSTPSGLPSHVTNPAFQVTPRFVRELVHWCLDADCLTTPSWI